MDSIDNELQGYIPNLLEERKRWDENISYGLIPIPTKCSECNKTISIKNVARFFICEIIKFMKHKLFILI